MDDFSQNYELEPPDYENTILKDLADDIKQSNAEVSKQIESFAQENRKSGEKSSTVAVVTLIVAVLTLIATIVGIVIR